MTWAGWPLSWRTTQRHELHHQPTIDGRDSALGVTTKEKI
jgi:hypothetical protein